MIQQRIFLFILLLITTPPVFSQSLYFLPSEEEGRVEVVAQGLDPSLFSFYVLFPQGRRESLALERGRFIPSWEGKGDYRLYGDYVDEDLQFRAKMLFSSPGRERTHSEGVGGGYLEILPLLPPEDMKKGRSFSGRVLKNGVPMEGVTMEVLEFGRETFSLQVNREGFFTLPLRRPGIYLLTATYPGAGLLWVSTYTFRVYDDTQERVIGHYLFLLFLLLLFFLVLIRYLKRTMG